ncbi:cupin domain-containing protein [Lysobacter pythonis]|uniref:Cupin domain-containing protein n=1 Tax=Solilutibacter pythonis TaxID=2483112 RepID=A0A3M2I6S5_9GAMM|nr:cupin domain-containing protein [Lysobacter pythonis]RMH94912.1 cupin domain-containing protein [Lysobacter pythonis]
MSAQHIVPVEIDASGKGMLGMPPVQFLREYWQKKPLLIRNAFPAFESPIQPEDLAGLACEEGALARIVRHDWETDGWQLESGPFPEEKFPDMPRQDWTLLVQDVDKWDADVRALLDHFPFLPRWRMDDIMVSFAAPGGSVGAHIDNYDVFLIQGVGHRRWQIDTRARPDETYRDDVPLRLLKHFDPNQDWVLAPGDMLYLPPGVPHHGIAEDACLTISVGLRAPSSAELLEHYADTLAFDADERIRYADTDLDLPKDPNEIDEAALDRALSALNQLRLSSRDELGEWFGRFVSAYRVAEGQAPSPADATGRDLARDIAEGAVWARHPYSRMAWRQSGNDALLFANGGAWPATVADARRIAGAEMLDQALLTTLTARGRALLQTLADAGHYQLVEDE